MLFAKFNINGQETAQLYDNWEQYHADTFNPDTRFITLIEFVSHGKDYQSRKESVRTLAIEWSNSDIEGIDYYDLQSVGLWFEKMGKRYGLMEEFEENGICW